MVSIPEALRKKQIDPAPIIEHSIVSTLLLHSDPTERLSLIVFILHLAKYCLLILAKPFR